jgi:putative membrane-bound dehydrogenase-like protein
VAIDVDITGAKELYLVVRDGGDGFGCDWADWAEPKLLGPQGEQKLTELKWKSATTGFGAVHVNANCEGRPLKIGGRAVAYGIGTHAPSVIAYDLPPGFQRFQAKAGLDHGGTNQGCGSTVQFLVYTQPPPAKIAEPSPGAGEASHDLKDALAGLDVADGLEATLFAGEPTLLSPSNIDVDHLGRVWVCEVVNYRRFANKERQDRPEGDRILVLEDTDGDGICDRSTVFYQGRDIDSAHGVCVLGERVIISCGDSVFSLYDRNGDLKADPGSKEFLFTGISGVQHDHGIHAVVFGPDGRLYFNFGNSGKQLKDRHGQPIVDKAGNEINDSRRPYQEGMVFRCNPDGTAVETLGWNFRNNWEVCVDSFGTMWQSDNDDDGNRGVRINYVMEFGNYGYKDELTGAGWQTPRTNLEPDIPSRHWHQNDPGVVPNLLQTGAGSPTGICVYEGDLLPEVFRNQIIHCDAGPNVVRCYPVKASGAGYTADLVNILEGTRDKWFRPSDVCVAPDGSLIIADWYDPGVGGHRQGDVDRGRIFRVAPPGKKYVVPKVDLSTAEGALSALKSPNHATRYLGWRILHELGEKAEPLLVQTFRDDPNPRFRARALWLLSRLPSKGLQYVAEGLKDPSVDVRCTAIRAARQHGPDTVLTKLTLPRPADTPARLRREILLALRECSDTPEKFALWAAIAHTYDGQDRWMLEALGIGAGKSWDKCLEFLHGSEAGGDASWSLGSKKHRDIIWRSRARQTPALLVRILSDPQVPSDELPRYFRAFDFLSGPEKDAAIQTLAFTELSRDESRQSFLTAEAVQRLHAFDLSQQPEKRAALHRVLDRWRGTPAFVTLVDRFNLQERYPQVVAILEEQPDTSLAVDAVKLLLAKDSGGLLPKALKQDEALKAAAVARALGNAADNRTTPLLAPLVADERAPLAVRQEAVKALGKSKAGARHLLDRVKQRQLAEELQQAAAFALQSSPFADFQAEVAALFPLPPARNEQPLPPLSQLLKAKGRVDQGKVVFNTVGKCNTCHVVNGEGKEVGPNLSEIGSKLSREALFESILFPSAGISHNYETWTAVTDGGNVVTGIKVSETGSEIVLRGPDAITRTIKKADLEELKKQPTSLMPADLQKTMTAEELIDVIEYVQTLKKK